MLECGTLKAILIKVGSMTIQRLLLPSLSSNILKVALVTIPLALPLRIYANRYEQIAVMNLQRVYLLLLALCAVSTLLVAFTRNSIGRILYAVLFGLTLTFWMAYQSILHTFMTYDSFIAMFNSKGFIGDALIQFLPLFIKPTVLGLIVFAGIALPPAWHERRPLLEILAWALAPMVILGITAIAYARGGDGLQGLPGHDVIAAYFTLLGVEVYRAEKVPREEVALASISGKPDFDVVLIVDESVRGDFLDIGDPSGLASHLLRTNPAVHNFGLAASGNNCSDGSNMMLRFGGTRADYRLTSDHKPSIFHYAKHRGFKTIYVDAQRTGKRLQNGMDAYELSAIDQFIQFDDVKIVDRDIRIAELISARSRNGEPEFIYVNKVGAHFPVHD
jgi:glucan phosphoethanolaminetransferase (alkaline phosphatase superfamily)